MREILIVFSAFIVGCGQIFSESDCSDRLIKSVGSDDGEFIANVIVRDCGATTAPANIIFLRGKLASQGEGGPWGEKIYVWKGGRDISVEWIGSQINIGAPSAGEDVFLAKTKWRNIIIKYGA